MIPFVYLVLSATDISYSHKRITETQHFPCFTEWQKTINIIYILNVDKKISII